MVSSINSISSAMSMMTMSSTQRPPPPPEEDVFQLSDTDSDGVVSSGTELDTLIEAIQETTGTTGIDSETVSNTFDLDATSGLSGEEVLEMLNNYGFTPPQAAAGEEGNSSTMPPPPPVSAEQAISAYTQNSGEDKAGQLLELLQNSNVTAGIDLTL